MSHASLTDLSRDGGRVALWTRATRRSFVFGFARVLRKWSAEGIYEIHYFATRLRISRERAPYFRG